MTDIQKAASVLGSIKSRVKSKAARANGKLSAGRPGKVPEGQILIISGEKNGMEHIYRYIGKRTKKGIQDEVAIEKFSGRWANVWIEMKGIFESGIQVFGRYNARITEIKEVRAIKL
jgi:hypothetical protein